MEGGPIKVIESPLLADFKTRVGKVMAASILSGQYCLDSSSISIGVIFPNVFCDSMIKMICVHWILYIGSL